MVRRMVMAAAAFALLGCVPAGTGAADPAPATGASIVRIGEEVRLGGLAVRALRLVEDSRCPLSVQCVHAGTVRLAVRLTEGGRTREAVLRIETPEPVAGGRYLWLVAACPVPREPGAQPPAGAYHFLVGAGANMTEVPLDHSCGPA